MLLQDTLQARSFPHPPIFTWQVKDQASARRLYRTPLVSDISRSLPSGEGREAYRTVRGSGCSLGPKVPFSWPAVSDDAVG